MKFVDGSLVSSIPSATVLMLRDAPQGMEVFLLKRHGLSDVMSFPAGRRTATTWRSSNGLISRWRLIPTIARENVSSTTGRKRHDDP